MADTTLTRGEVAVGSAERGKAGRARRFWYRLYDRLRRHSISVYALALSFILFLLVLAPQIFVNVPAGYVGVLWLRFFGGTVTTSHLDEGLHVIFPWDEVYLYDARLQNRARVYDTISSNGLSMQVEIAIRYRINRDTVGLLHQQIGPNYDEVLVYPEIGSHARELISRYTPEQLYSETRAFIQAQLLERMVTQLGASLGNQSLRGRLVDVEDVLIRSVNLPTRVQDAIERKAEQYQAMLEYDFRLAREKKEAERKKIEADGIREFQDTVARTITPEYLRLRGIEATMTLAASPNSKIIVVGGKDGLPLILNTADDPTSRPALPAGSGEAPSGTDALRPSPPNAKLDDVAPTNAAVPLNLPASSPTGAPADSQRNKDAVSTSSEGTADPAVSEQGLDGQPDSTTLSAPDSKAPASP
jgi:regulator of protease activity HflC (stomatin/prohibitin superfamily)